MDRNTPFGSAGWQSFQQYPQPQDLQNQLQNINEFNHQQFNYNQQVLTGQEAKMRSLMQDYEFLRRDLNQVGQGQPISHRQGNQQQQQGRPYSRELDLMNLLLVGSMDNGRSKSGLEGMDDLFNRGNDRKNNQQQYQQLDILSSQQQPQQNQYPQYYEAQSSQYQQQQPQQQPQYQQPSQYSYQGQYQQQYEQYQLAKTNIQQSTSPPSLYLQRQGNAADKSSNNLRQNAQLIINGQMGLNVDTTNQQPNDQQMEKPSDRITKHIERQNTVLAELSKNLLKERETKDSSQKISLLERVKELESLNLKDRGYNEMYDRDFEYPMYQRHKMGMVQPRPNPNIVSRQQQMMNHNGQQMMIQNPMIQPMSRMTNQNPMVHPMSRMTNYEQNNQKLNQQNPRNERLENLRSMVLMKRMKEDMNIQNQQKQRYRDEYINDSDDLSSYSEGDGPVSNGQSDEESEEYFEPRELVPRNNKPKPYDPQQDISKLEQLKRGRGLINLKTFFWQFAYIIWYRNWMKEYIISKKTQSQSAMLREIGEFYQGTQNWITRVCKTSLEKIVKPPNMDLTIVKIVKEKTLLKNSQALMDIVKMIIEQIVQNSKDSDLPEQMVNFIGRLTHEREFIVGGYLTRFEINRLNFAYFGGLQAMNGNKAKMLICINIWIRVLILRIFQQPWMIVQGTVLTDQMKINSKTICSVLYELIITFVKEKAPIIQDNQNNLSLEHQITPIKEPYLQLDFVPTQQNMLWVQDKIKSGSDEPLVFPLYLREEMDYLFKNNAPWIKSINTLLKTWTDQIGLIIKDNHLQDRNEVLEKNQQLRQMAATKYIGISPRVLQICNKHRADYISLTQEIESLKQRIQELSKKGLQNAKNQLNEIRQQERQQIALIKNQGGRSTYGAQRSI